MNRLFEIGEIGLLQDIPAELTFMTNENKLLIQKNDKLRFEKSILIFSIDQFFNQLCNRCANL
jgi:hypothetical protein